MSGIGTIPEDIHLKRYEKFRNEELETICAIGAKLYKTSVNEFIISNAASKLAIFFHFLHNNCKDGRNGKYKFPRYGNRSKTKV